jgi:hypothetical protein
MPNWCQNYVKIYGPKDKIKNLFDKIKKQNEFLNVLVPTGKDMSDEWFDENWGVSCDVEIDDIEYTEQFSPESLAWIDGYFESAWVPPNECFITFTKENEDCWYENYFFEPGMDFAGCSGIWGEEEIQVSDYQSRIFLNADQEDNLFGVLNKRFKIGYEKAKWESENYCERCIEPYTDENDEEFDGEEVPIKYVCCNICADCEHFDDCEGIKRKKIKPKLKKR